MIQLSLNFTNKIPAEWYEDFEIWGWDADKNKRVCFTVPVPKKEYLKRIINFYESTADS